MIRGEGLSKAFGSLSVLRDMSLTVETGETVAVLGRSGSGKSVFLKLVAGLLEPDGGTVRVGEESITGAPGERVRRLRLRMGYVFQGGALFDSMTVGQNLALPLRRRGIDGLDLDRRVTRTLETVGLGGLEERMPAELSGGMRKRAAVARAVVAEPEYLLYDEPTTGLDPVTTAMIDELMIRLKEELRATSVVVTHDLRSAFRVADRVGMLHEGKLRAVGTPADFENSDDPVVRAFVEGRLDLWRAAGSGPDGG